VVGRSVNGLRKRKSGHSAPPRATDVRSRCKADMLLFVVSCLAFGCEMRKNSPSRSCGGPDSCGHGAALAICFDISDGKDTVADGICWGVRAGLATRSARCFPTYSSSPVFVPPKAQRGFLVLPVLVSCRLERFGDEAVRSPVGNAVGTGGLLAGVQRR